ncbi:MAG TPA: type I glutamate--ammonia ligase [Fimbriimonadaceae bacterium]|nr:type I glutamate--ammonia ligase [Fimbriimonadaceae bacterium]
MAAKEALELIKNQEAQFVDFRFTDLFGVWHHFTIPANQFEAEMFEDGLGFDGSSIRGFQAINESDMLLMPDPDTIFMDPFAHHPTAVMVGDVEDPITRERYSRDPRYVAHKATQYLRSTGIGDTVYFGPEAEFFVFDKMAFLNSPHECSFQVDSAEAHWNSNDEGALGYLHRPKGGYFPCAPSDKLHDLRSEMVLMLQEVGVDVELHHHEVGAAGQCEIDIRFNEMLTMGDTLQKYKYVVKNTAARYGMAATFMPKPLLGDNGSGMHCHQSIWKNGENVFFDQQGYAGLSDSARWYIGGLLKHAPSILAFSNPSTNSYRRLVPGFEAPINLIYSARNRSACIRIPMFSNSPKAKRIEFRAPDPSCNPYLAFSAMLMAGLDGIQNRIEPLDPIDKDLYELPPEEKADIPQTPRTFREVLENLREDQDFLMKGDVFTQDLLDAYVDYKLKHECLEIEVRPHPYEFFLYNDI